MRIVTIVGARPQFVKAGPVSSALRRAGIQEYLVHTGQHYDQGMSDVFFSELDIPPPDINLEVGSASHGAQTGMMMVRIEKVLVAQQPRWVLVYGDTNSTLAGALAGAKLHVDVAHVEAGLRSFNRQMPEEINRVVSDHLSALLFCPGEAAAANLRSEGMSQGVHVVGDVMCDALLSVAGRVSSRKGIVENLGLEPGAYLLATLHRAENTDDPYRLRSVLEALQELATHEMVVFPVHPRTRKALQAMGDSDVERIRLLPPLGYLDMVALEKSARLILTDSGGVQKEAYWLGVPCVTLRHETEWVETVAAGWNVLAGTTASDILEAVRGYRLPSTRADLYGDGHAADQIAAVILKQG